LYLLRRPCALTKRAEVESQIFPSVRSDQPHFSFYTFLLMDFNFPVPPLQPSYVLP